MRRYWTLIGKLRVGAGVTLAPENVTLTFWSRPTGVPGFGGGGGGPVELPPPHEPIATSDASANTANATRQPREFDTARMPASNKATQNKIAAASATISLGDMLGPFGRGRAGASAAAGAVVWQVAVAVAVMPLPASETDVGLKLQVVSDGRPLKSEELSGIEPVNPFCEVNVSVAEPLCPGAATVMVVGFAETLKLGTAATVSEIADDVEPE